MRAAFVGLSTPLFYDYKNSASKTQADTASSPNPILDSPFGLFLLFDEIWFLCRSLCPENMRSLPYVKFLDESGDFPSLIDCQSEAKRLAENVDDEPVLRLRRERYYKSFDVYDETRNRVGVHWDAAADNHTHGLQIGDIIISANSVSLQNLFFDIEVMKTMKNKNVEFIANSFTQRFLEERDSPIMKSKLAETLIIENIPNYLHSSGPYHPCVEEVRANSYLKAYREWISKQHISVDENELRDIKSEVETAIQRGQDDIFLKYLDQKTQFFSVGKKLIGIGADVLLPGV